MTAGGTWRQKHAQSQKNQKCLLFYAGLLHSEITMDKPLGHLDREIYNGGYLFNLHDREWYRCDRTLVLLDHVPKELRTLVLLLSG